MLIAGVFVEDVNKQGRGRERVAVCVALFSSMFAFTCDSGRDCGDRKRNSVVEASLLRKCRMVTSDFTISTLQFSDRNTISPIVHVFSR